MLNLAQDTIQTESKVYEDMPLRAYAITLMHNDSMKEELPEQVYQGRSVSEAVQAAEIRELDNPCYPAPNPNDGFKAAWTAHWKQSPCKPRFIVGKVRDLGLVMNQDEEVRCPS